jgi:preprotein translocase subunit SecA
MLDGIKEESVGFLFNLEVKSQEDQEAEALAAQQAAEAEALARAQEGTARVLARQAVEQAAAANGNGASGNGSGHGSGTATATPSARRSGRTPAQAAAAPVAEPEQTDLPAGLAGIKGLETPKRSGDLTYSAPSLDASPKESGAAKAAKTATVTGSKEPSRNAPCPCGSGKKYKVCHGRPGQHL